ncbi:hypothetical protein BGX21_005790 [Mortierella sp. AD011]|nr:hypothetical protein BGX20_005745 [Mortierella sp. AD010]KAF9399682.1 hypothetical protein BGX21_005790 [Mortierella sp. AD011]
MKFTTSIATIALGAIALSASSVDAAVSAGCTAYINSISVASSPLAACRTYTALGFPNITYTHDHDTTKLQSELDTFCAKTACTDAQYASVFKDLQTNCGADMTAANQAALGTVLYMWYSSPAQRDAICLKDTTSKNNTNCVITSINEMIARGQLPDGNVNEDDLYGYIQYVTPLSSMTGINSTSAFCTSCNQQVANIFSNYYTKTPSPFALNLDQNLTSAILNANLMDQYKRNCGATLGLPVASNGTTPGSDGTFQPTNNTQTGTSGKSAANALSAGGFVAVVSAVVGALAMF